MIQRKTKRSITSMNYLSLLHLLLFGFRKQKSRIPITHFLACIGKFVLNIISIAKRATMYMSWTMHRNLIRFIFHYLNWDIIPRLQGIHLVCIRRSHIKFVVIHSGNCSQFDAYFLRKSSMRWYINRLRLMLFHWLVKSIDFLSALFLILKGIDFLAFVYFCAIVWLFSYENVSRRWKFDFNINKCIAMLYYIKIIDSN